jgi:hypothetical protein
MKEKKTEILTLRVTPKERELIEQEASKNDFPISSWLRIKVLGLHYGKVLSKCYGSDSGYTYYDPVYTGYIKEDENGKKRS